MMKAQSIKKIVIAMAIALVVAVLPAAGMNHVLAETAKTEETSKKPTTKKASDKKDEVKKEVKKVSNEKKEKVEEAKNEDQPASTVQANSQAVQQTSQQASSSNITYSSEPAHNVNEPIQGSIQIEQIPETSSDVQEATTTTSSVIQVETPAQEPSQPSDGTEGVHQQPTVVVDEVVELN